jgi:predicted nucleotidyltransferase component of viral defense system
VANLYKYSKNYFGKRASETGFIRDSLEKVYRLADILEYINTNPLHRDCLALKGGTAINLTVFNMPRLSVDIDLDFCKLITRKEMLGYRMRINEDLIAFLQTQGYSLNLERSKNPHSLDSWVFWYQNSAGNRDNIKIEINYSMRAHILPIIDLPIQTDLLERSFDLKVLSPLELFGTKINALISRTASKDLYDIDNMVYFGTFDESELPMLKKCSLFYFAVGSGKKFETTFDLSEIDSLTWNKIKQTLLPVLRRSDKFDLDVSRNRVKRFLNELINLERGEQEFLHRFKKKEYLPELLFDDAVIIDRIKNHPMALWKIRDKR